MVLRGSLNVSEFSLSLALGYESLYWDWSIDMFRVSFAFCRMRKGDGDSDGDGDGDDLLKYGCP